MKRNRFFIPTSANHINADSALPDFMQKSAEDSDSPKTWSEIVAVHGLSNHAEASALAPLIKITPPNGFVFQRRR